jgi:hypothetical protein
MTIEIRLHPSIDIIPEATWDALDGVADAPFLSWAFLDTLEKTGCVGEEAGWLPHHLTIWEGDRLVGAAPAYLKGNSDGEFVFDHGGTLVCYMGDGIMAVFGSPIEREEHADMALAAAREMVGERLDRFNDWLRAEGISEGLRMGIGLNSGPVLSGHVGSERRLEYAAIGDTTNVASRLEGMTKGTEHQLFIAASTRRALRHPASDLVDLGALDIAGRDAPIEVWTLGDGRPVASGNGAAAVSGATAAGPAA